MSAARIALAEKAARNIADKIIAKFEARPMTVSKEKIAEMLTPWRLEQPEKWPFRLIVLDAAGNVVLSEDRYAHASNDKTVADALNCVHFGHGPDRDEGISANAAQVAKFEAIVAAVNSSTTLRSQLSGLTDETSSWMSIFTVEGDEDTVRLSVFGKEIAAWSAQGPEGIALLKLDALRREASK